MIFYAQDHERWEDTENIEWFVCMAPDGKKDIEKEFETKEKFWEWFFNKGE